MATAPSYNTQHVETLMHVIPAIIIAFGAIKLGERYLDILADAKGLDIIRRRLDNLEARHEYIARQLEGHQVAIDGLNGSTLKKVGTFLEQFRTHKEVQEFLAQCRTSAELVERIEHIESQLGVEPKAVETEAA